MNPSVLIFILITILSFFSSLILIIIAPELNVFNYSLLAMGFIGTGLMAYKYKESLAGNKRIFIISLREGLRFFLILACIAIINFIFFKVNKSFDFTSTKVNTLSAQTLETLNKVQGPIELTLFAQRDEWSKYENLLKLYLNTNSNLSLEIVDLESKPELVRLNHISKSGDLLASCNSKKLRVHALDELAVTNLLIRCLQKKSKTIFYTSGRDELNFSDTGPTGGTELRSLIAANAIDLKPISLSSRVPIEVESLMILDPKDYFSEGELGNLSLYLKRGGNLFIAISPDFDNKVILSLQKVLMEAGVFFVNSLVLDGEAAKSGGEASIPFSKNFDKDHPITKNFDKRVLFPISGFFKIINGPKLNTKALVLSHDFPGSWGESNFEEVRKGKANFSEAEDFKGPLPLAIAIDYKEREGRVFALSSGSMLQNQFKKQSFNFDFILNGISWLMGSEEFITIERNSKAGSLIFISELNLSVIFYLSVLFIPFLLFFGAIFLFRRGKLN